MTDTPDLAGMTPAEIFELICQWARVRGPADPTAPPGFWEAYRALPDAMKQEILMECEFREFWLDEEPPAPAPEPPAHPESLVKRLCRLREEFLRGHP
jgi:hypothetical protein